jgi:hypothetical protein
MELVPANGLWNFPMSDELRTEMQNIWQDAQCEPDYHKGTSKNYYCYTGLISVSFSF